MNAASAIASSRKFLTSRAGARCDAADNHRQRNWDWCCHRSRILARKLRGLHTTRSVPSIQSRQRCTILRVALYRASGFVLSPQLGLTNLASDPAAVRDKRW